MLEAGWTVVVERVERQLPTFARASKNLATIATVLDTLLAPSVDRVSKIYQRLKSILRTTIV
jgi:hypothetical protein